MDILRAYSNRDDLLNDLVRAARQLERAAKTPEKERWSVSSTGRVGRVLAVKDRLSPEDVRAMVESFRAGVAKHRLAASYGISESSVKRILRQHRAVTEG